MSITSQFILSRTSLTLNCGRLLLDLVSETVRKYRMQSPGHFALHINVQPYSGSRPIGDASRVQLAIAFQNYSQRYIWICERLWKKGHLTRKIVVKGDKYSKPLQKVLAEYFPVSAM